MADAGTQSRAVAAQALAAVRQGRALPEALAAVGGSLSASDRAFARRLAQQVLRQRNRLEWLLKPALKRPPKPAWVYELLLLGLAQVEDPELPDHAAVAATVGAAPQKVRGLLNAILRRATRGELGRELPGGEQGDALRAGLPIWLLQAIRRDWREQSEAVIEGGNQPPPFALRVNLRAQSREAYQNELREHGLEAEAVGTQGLILEQAPVLAELPGFAAGRVSVQNPSAQCAAGLFSLEPGLRVLDACAAPGGKTAHLLEREPQLALTALDVSPERLDDVAAGLRRQNLRAELVCARLQDHQPAEPYQRILLDVPCSATGVLRRHPDIRWLRREGDLRVLVEEQQAMLAHAWSLLAPGGALLYASCSILYRETEAVVKAFCAGHADAQSQPLELPAGRPTRHGWRIPPGGAWDGFYYSLLHKQPSDAG